MKTLNLARVFSQDASSLREARERALATHFTDIRAAGNEVEVAVRAYLRRMLPPRFHVTHGHLIDSDQRVSPQLDVIVADNFSLPSLLTTSDGTEYVPATSALAIGEVKSTYYQSKRYFERMQVVLADIGSMNRPLIANTAYNGLESHTLLTDIVLPNKNKYLNNLFSFFLSVDAGDFDFQNVKTTFAESRVAHLPNLSVLLNRGMIMYGRTQGGQLSVEDYPSTANGSGYDWMFAEGMALDGGTKEGTHLLMLFGALMEHLAWIRLEPPNVGEYIGRMKAYSRSSLVWAGEDQR